MRPAAELGATQLPTGRSPPRLPEAWRSRSLDRDHNPGRAVLESARKPLSSPSQAAIAWTLRQPRVASVILAASSVAQLQETLLAADARLDSEACAHITHAVSLREAALPADWRPINTQAEET